MAAGRAVGATSEPPSKPAPPDTEFRRLFCDAFEFIAGALAERLVRTVQVEFLGKQPRLGAVLRFDTGVGQQRLHLCTDCGLLDPGNLDHFEELVGQNLPAGFKHRAFALHRGGKRHEVNEARADDVVEWNVQQSKSLIGPCWAAAPGNAALNSRFGSLLKSPGWPAVPKPAHRIPTSNRSR